MKHSTLVISSGGGQIILAIPTHAEAERIQEVIDALLDKTD